MLVFNRKKGQAIAIGPDIRVVVVETHTGSVRLAVAAPQHYRVARVEKLEESGQSGQSGKPGEERK